MSFREISPSKTSFVLPASDPAGAYDPYNFRTGRISNIYAFLHLVKCAFGTGVLTFPYGFHNAGMILGSVIGFGVSGFCIYCFHMLIKGMMNSAAEQKVPYVTFPDAVKHSMDIAQWKRKCSTNALRGFTDGVISLYHFGICTAYVSYVVSSCLTIAGKTKEAEGPINALRSYVTFVWMIPLYMVNCLRDLKSLGPVSLIGNITTLTAMGVIIYFIFAPDDIGFSTNLTMVGSIETAPLFIGTVLFSVESFGVILAVEHDMRKPKSFRGYVGIFNLSMTVVVLWYMFIGALGYWKYGDDKIKSTIVLTIPSDTYLAIGLQVTMCVAVFCSYPLQCYVVFELIWRCYIAPKITSRGKLVYEYLFRFAITLATGVFGLMIPKLDLLVSLIGSVCLSILAIIMPGLLEYNLTYGMHKWKKPFTLIKDIFVMIAGAFFLVVGTYVSIYGIIKHS